MDDFEKPAESCFEQASLLEQETLCCSDIEELLDFYLDGELLPQLEEKFQTHLLECELCEELAHDCRHLVTLARSLNDAPMPEEVQSRLREALKREVGFNPTGNPNQGVSRGKLSVVKPTS